MDEFKKLLASAKGCYSSRGKAKNCEHKHCLKLSKRNSLIVQFLIDTGARVSEVSGVRRCDLNDFDPEGWFHESYTKRKKTRWFKLN